MRRGACTCRYRCRGVNRRGALRSHPARDDGSSVKKSRSGVTRRRIGGVALAAAALMLALTLGRPASVVDRVQASALIPADVQTLTMNSPALGGSTHVLILLPDGYATTAQRYPVLYLLAGHLGTYQQWETKS